MDILVKACWLQERAAALQAFARAWYDYDPKYHDLVSNAQEQASRAHWTMRLLLRTTEKPGECSP